MVEYFTQNDTELSVEVSSMVGKTDEIFEENLKSNLKALVKDPNPQTIENILAFSRSLRK